MPTIIQELSPKYSNIKYHSSIFLLEFSGLFTLFFPLILALNFPITSFSLSNAHLYSFFRDTSELSTKFILFIFAAIATEDMAEHLISQVIIQQSRRMFWRMEIMDYFLRMFLGRLNFIRQTLKSQFRETEGNQQSKVDIIQDQVQRNCQFLQGTRNIERMLVKYTGQIQFILEAMTRQEMAISWSRGTGGDFKEMYLSRQETAWKIVSSWRSRRHRVEKIHSTSLHLATKRGSSGPEKGQWQVKAIFSVCWSISGGISQLGVIWSSSLSRVRVGRVVLDWGLLERSLMETIGWLEISFSIIFYFIISFVFYWFFPFPSSYNPYIIQYTIIISQQQQDIRVGSREQLNRRQSVCLLLDPLLVLGLHLRVLLQPPRDVPLVLLVLFQDVVLHLLVHVELKVGVMLGAFQRVCVAEAGQVVEGVVEFLVVEDQITEQVVGFVSEFVGFWVGNHRLQGIQPVDPDQDPFGLQVLPSNQAAERTHHGLSHRQLLLRCYPFQHLEGPSVDRFSLNLGIVLVRKAEDPCRHQDIARVV